MKISCQSCPAKYTIADEKVVGKIVKIRCRKCGATIVVNGNDAAALSASQDATSADVGTGDTELWTVNVAEGDQRTFSAAEVAQEFRAGTINEETYVWKDGMGDWLPLREVPELFEQVQSAHTPSMSSGLGGANLFSSPPSGPAPGFNSQPAPAFPSAPPPRFPSAPAAAMASSPVPFDAGFGSSPNGDGHHSSHPPSYGGTPGMGTSAARRAGGRGAAVDLFGAQAEAAEPPAPAFGEEPKLTGQRNENSVLFSLSALTSKEGGQELDNRSTAGSEGSGLIDIRALSASVATSGGGNASGNAARLDDIMNLGGGGAFGAALTAPVLAPPTSLPVASSQYPTAEKGGNNKMLLFGLIAIGALLLVAIVLVVVLITSKPTVVAVVPTAATSEAMSAKVDVPPQASASSDTPASNPTAVAVAPGTGHATGPAATPGKATGGGTGAKVATNDSPKGDTTPPPAAPAAPAAPKSLEEAMAGAAGPKKEPQGGGGGGGAGAAPFDRGAAAGALGAINVASCKKPDGPTGSGHVKVTFDPSGSVSSAVADTPPYSGTAVGGCIAGKFRAARVPAFSGSPISVGKSFVIN